MDSRRKMSGMYSWHNYTSTSARQNTDPLLKNPSRLVRSGFVIFDLISKQNLDLRVDSERYRIALSNDMTLTVTRLGAFGTRFLTYKLFQSGCLIRASRADSNTLSVGCSISYAATEWHNPQRVIQFPSKFRNDWSLWRSSRRIRRFHANTNFLISKS